MERERLLVRDGDRDGWTSTSIGVDHGVEGADVDVDERANTMGGWKRHRRRTTAVVTSAVVAGALVCYGTVFSIFERGFFGASDRGTRTRREFGALSVLSWTPRDGFRRVGRGSGGLFRNEIARNHLMHTIERYYPSRLTNASAPFEVNFIVDDCPHTPCADPRYRAKHCHVDQWEPIFAFGSAPKDASVFPTMVSSTLVPLMYCVAAEQSLANASFVVTSETEPACDFLKYPAVIDNKPECDAKSSKRGDSACRYFGLFNLNIMPNKSDYEWDNLLKRGIWRGSDYPLYTGFWPNKKTNGLRFQQRLMRTNASETTREIEALLKGREIGPRLRAVLMSKRHPEKLDAKFFNWGGGGPSPGRDTLDFVDTNHIEMDTFARYKYQLDLGGGGGTTWSGLIPKLSVPGVLFHHETMMKDSYFDTLKPYVHYLPLKEDLSNFDELAAWVEAHPSEAKAISDAATAWVHEFRKLANLLRYNYEVLVKPLARALDSSGELRPIPFEIAHPGV